MTYNDVKVAENNMMVARRKYHEAVYDFLNQSLTEAGFAGKTVIVKETGEKGFLQVSESGIGGIFTPFEIKFYPLKKDGNVSQVARRIHGLYSFNILSDRCVKHLQSVFEVAEKE